MMNTKRTFAQLTVLGCCAVAVSVAHATDGPAAADRAAPAATEAAARAGSATSGATAGGTGAAAHARIGERTHLRVLRSPRDPRHDAVPARVRSSALLSAGDVDLAVARRVTAAGGEQAWIAPSTDGASICGVRAGAVACPSAALLEVTGLSPGINGRLGEPFHVWGIAGDDVSSIVLVEADGGRTAVSVTDNFFDVETEEWPRSLTWTGPSGPESFTFPAYP